MRSRLGCIAALLALALTAHTAPMAGRRSSSVSESRSFSRELPARGISALVVSNIHGDVVLTGGGGRTISVEVREVLHGRRQEDLEYAREETSLEFETRGDTLVICADGPFRDPDDCTEHRRHHRGDEGYWVEYDLEIRIPSRMTVDVRTVNGEMQVSGIQGRFDVHSVNGPIRMLDIDGSGRARTVNGGVSVTFSGNPTEDSSFSTINGDIDVRFQDGFAAELSFDTMNGEILTDFSYEVLPPRPVTTRSRGATTKYKLESTTLVRVASGGPRLDFKNLNGDILVRRHP